MTLQGYGQVGNVLEGWSFFHMEQYRGGKVQRRGEAGPWQF